MLESLKETVQKLRGDELTIYYIGKNKNTPFLQKLMARVVAAYVFSPVDLLPDFIPVLGYLDDFLLAIGFAWFVLETTPASIIDDSRDKAKNHTTGKPKNYLVTMLVLVVWVAAGIILGDVIKKMLGH